MCIRDRFKVGEPIGAVIGGQCVGMGAYLVEKSAVDGVFSAVHGSSWYRRSGVVGFGTVGWRGLYPYAAGDYVGWVPVSYTHLDVYKRQYCGLR